MSSEVLKALKVERRAVAYQLAQLDKMIELAGGKVDGRTKRRKKPGPKPGTKRKVAKVPAAAVREAKATKKEIKRVIGPGATLKFKKSKRADKAVREVAKESATERMARVRAEAKSKEKD